MTISSSVSHLPVIRRSVSGLPQLQIKPNRAAIARYGLNVEDINDVVEALVAGKPAGLVYQGEQRSGLVVRFDESTSRNQETIRNGDGLSNRWLAASS